MVNTYDVRNQLIKSVTADATITNTYNAAGYRVGKSVTENGKTSKTYFLYDGSNVIMEADEKGVTAKNTYGGPLLLRTVFDDAGEETYQYLYNAHGDVVTLLSEGEVAATYYYDSFGNILEQTGEVDNSILYAGYQYDEETGLYYINARMYDPVTARFLQVDTYPGNQNDPLSLNFYTYCLNNPHKYADPSGHFAITAAVIIGAVIWGIVGAAVEYKAQKDAGGMIDYNQVLFQGILNAGIALVSAGLANGAMATAQGARMTAGAFGRMLLAEAGLGIAEGIIAETGRQLIGGTKPNELDAGSIASSGVMGGISGVGGAIVGEGLEIGLKALKNSRMVSRIVSKARNLKNKGLDVVQTGWRRITSKGSKAAGESVLDSLDEPVSKLTLQSVASDGAYQTSYGKSSSNIVNKQKGWNVGEPIDNLTKAGKEPSWSTVKARYWKNEAYYNPDMYSRKNLDLMEKGKAPRHNMIDVPQELHHINGRNIDNPHNIDNLMPVWPWEHAEIDPYRYYKGPRP